MYVARNQAQHGLVCVSIMRPMKDYCQASKSPLEHAIVGILLMPSCMRRQMVIIMHQVNANICRIQSDSIDLSASEVHRGQQKPLCRDKGAGTDVEADQS